TVTVEQNDGSGWEPAEDVDVDPTAIGVGSSARRACETGSTNEKGHYTVKDDSDSSGTSTVNATATVTVAALDVDVSTSGHGAHVISNVKTWIDARITIEEDATNRVGGPHAFTVTVEKNDGSGWEPVQGVTVDPDATGV